jgi:hypothetical protein
VNENSRTCWDLSDPKLGKGLNANDDMGGSSIIFLIISINIIMSHNYASSYDIIPKNDEREIPGLSQFQGCLILCAFCLAYLLHLSITLIFKLNMNRAGHTKGRQNV